MFLRFNSRNGRIAVVRDNLIVVDMITVSPNSDGVLLVNKYNADKVSIFDILSVEYVKVNGTFIFIVDGEVCQDSKLVLCEDDNFIQMTRFIQKSMLIDGKTEYFNSGNLELVNSSSNKNK